MESARLVYRVSTCSIATEAPCDGKFSVIGTWTTAHLSGTTRSRLQRSSSQRSCKGHASEITRRSARVLFSSRWSVPRWIIYAIGLARRWHSPGTKNGEIVRQRNSRGKTLARHFKLFFHLFPLFPLNNSLSTCYLSINLGTGITKIALPKFRGS